MTNVETELAAIGLVSPGLEKARAALATAFQATS